MRSVREIRNQNKADNIDRIREIVERERGNVLSTDELQLEAAGMARNLPKIELYRRMNGLNFTQNISQQDLETVISAMEPRLNEVNQITEVEASIVDRPNVRAVLEKGCEAVFPDRTSEAAQREARENAAREFQNAMNAYASQRLVLCRLQAAINQRVYDNTELDPRALGGCEDTRPQCFYQRVTMADIGGGGFVARSLNWIMGSGQGRGSCSQEAPERYSLLMQGILSQDRNLIQRVLQQKDELERGVVEWLASQYLTQMPFTLIAAEAMHDLGQVPVRLSETILDPRRLDRRNPAHQAYIDRFTPRLAQDRCKRAPLEYLSVDFSEHVLRVIGEPRNTGAGSTNVTVFANISLGANESRDRTAGSSRSTHVDAGGKVSSGSQVAGQAGASFRVVGINAGQEVSIGTEKSLGTSQSWFVSDTVTRGEARSTSAGEGSSRTLNAEEISFRFNAETMKCLSFQPKERSLQVRPGGALVCQDQPSVREVNDTWYYVYLFFRNNNSPLHDSAADLQMRPWTLMIRGHDQFESFKLVLQNSALRLRLSPVRLPGPEAAMNQAFVTFQIDYRKLRDLPGLLSVKSLSWRTNVSAIRPSAGPVSNPAVPPAR
jgi:hypothetical protein